MHKQAHNSASIRRRARARGRANVYVRVYIYMYVYRYVSSLITVVDRRYISRVGRREAPVRAIRGASAIARERRRVTSIPSLCELYNITLVSRCVNKTAGESPRRTWRFSVSRLAVPRRRAVACPYELIDARTAPLTTPSLRRRVSILREGRTTRTTPGTRQAERESDDNPAANRSWVEARCQQSRAARRRFEKRCILAIKREGEIERDPRSKRRAIRSIFIAFAVTRDRGYEGGGENRGETSPGRPAVARRDSSVTWLHVVWWFTNYICIFTSTVSRRSFCAKRKQIRTGEKRRERNRHHWREGRLTTGAGHASARIKSWEYSAPSSAIYRVGKNQTYTAAWARARVCMCMWFYV